jgi:gluconolactonase
MRIRELASGLQFPEGPVVLADGSIALVEIARGTLTRVTQAGEVSVLATLGGGPNGAALDADGHMVVCNNGGFSWHRDPDGFLRPTGQSSDYQGGYIERVNLSTGRSERMFDRFPNTRHDGPYELPLRGPNDIVMDAHGGFYFTDLGKTRAREVDRAGVYYARCDGSAITEVAYPTLTANGIGLSPDQRTVVFVESESARLWALDLESPGQPRRYGFPSPSGARWIAQPGGRIQRFDSLKVDALGNIIVATLLTGGLTTISPDGRDITFLPLPDQYTTNLCFGGPDMRTVYVTLSGYGRLIAIDDWPTPGLRLNHQPSLL